MSWSLRPCGSDGIDVAEPNFEEGGGRSAMVLSNICSSSGISQAQACDDEWMRANFSFIHYT